MNVQLKLEMPKKAKKGKVKERKLGQNINKRPVEYATEGQDYGIVEKALGGQTYTVRLTDNSNVRGIKRHNRRRKMNELSKDPVGKIILVSFRDFDEKNVDIVHLYDYDESRQLLVEGKIPDWAAVCGSGTYDRKDDDKDENLDAYDFEDI